MLFFGLFSLFFGFNGVGGGFVILCPPYNVFGGSVWVWSRLFYESSRFLRKADIALAPTADIALTFEGAVIDEDIDTLGDIFGRDFRKVLRGGGIKDLGNDHGDFGELRASGGDDEGVCFFKRLSHAACLVYKQSCIKA